MKRESLAYNKHLIIIEHRAVDKFKLIVSNPKGKVIRWYNSRNKNIGIESCKRYILDCVK